MNNSEQNQDRVDLAVDAVLDRRNKGLISGNKRGGIAARLQQRSDDIKSLHEDLSAPIIAAELTQAGLPVSASTVQRVLRAEPAKRNKSTLKTTTRKPQMDGPTAPQSSISEKTIPATTPSKNATDAEALLKKMQEESGLIDADNNKTVASLKT